MAVETIVGVRQEIKRRLSTYRALKQEQIQIEDELRNLTGEPSGAQQDGTPRSSCVSNPVARVVERRIDLQNHYMKQLESLANAQLDIENLIEGLGPVERKLMRHRYLEGLSWENVCVAMAYSWRQTHNIHARALDKLAEGVRIAHDNP